MRVYFVFPYRNRIFAELKSAILACKLYGAVKPAPHNFIFPLSGTRALSLTLKDVLTISKQRYSMTNRLQILVKKFAEGRNTKFASLLGTNEARVRSYLTGTVLPKFDFLAAISERLGVSVDWLLTGEGEMLKADRASADASVHKAHRPEALPVYDNDFTCGFDEMANLLSAAPSYYMDTPLNRSADLWCSVQGKSMLPDLEPGDKIALRHCSLESFEPGHIYAVVLDDLRTVKKLRRVAGNPDLLEFVSSNPDYGVERYPISRIKQLYRVVGKLHSF